jgi:hypothetical protein
MDAARSPEATRRRLADALAEVADEDLPQVLEQARAGARARAAKVLEEALVDALVERASSSRGSSDADGALGWWVYGVTSAADADALPSGLPGVDGAGAVEVVVSGELAALVSPVPLAEYGDERIREHLNDLAWVERTARAHEAVLESALERVSVVPLRLCTIYRDREGVEKMLADDGEELAGAVERLRSRAEWGLKVFVLRDRVAEVARVEAGGAEGGEASSDAAQYLQRKRFDRELSDRIDRMATACAQECHARLKEVAAAARLNPPQRREAHGRDGEMILNGVYLVDDDQRGALADAIEELRGEYEPLGFEVEGTGPWPAYNFVAGEQ